ncbi:MAG: VOC family protein [Pararhodobacter sp.]|nr:VOC family protein [Pararhodobacter sp.]
MPRPFHLAFHVHDLDEARAFYGGVLGCAEGRASESWVDFDFFGHQLSLHRGIPFATADTGKVGEARVPMPHFGVILDRAGFQALAERLRGAGTRFIIEPHLRFAGEPGEQWTMFFADPSGNPIEVKGYDDDAGIFAR